MHAATDCLNSTHAYAGLVLGCECIHLQVWEGDHIPLPPHERTEEGVFRLLGLKYVEPTKRGCGKDFENQCIGDGNKLHDLKEDGAKRRKW